jgi:hypothetical protein
LLYVPRGSSETSRYEVRVREAKLLTHITTNADNLAGAKLQNFLSRIEPRYSAMANMVCDLCASLDLEQIPTAVRNGYKHHSSYAKLFKSAQNGCEFCGAIIGKYRGNDWMMLFSAQGRDFEVEEDEDGDDTQILITAEYHCRSKISVLQTAISRVVLGPHFQNLESQDLAKFCIYTNPGIYTSQSFPLCFPSPN